MCAASLEAADTKSAGIKAHKHIARMTPAKTPQEANVGFAELLWVFWGALFLSICSTVVAYARPLNSVFGSPGLCERNTMSQSLISRLFAVVVNT